MKELSQQIDWDKVSGLIPAIIQHDSTLEVLMLGYMNEEALKVTLEKKHVTFFSRTKSRLWTKGETSGHFLHLKSIHLDCDQDTLLIKAHPKGPTCHLGHSNCFQTSDFTLKTLEQVIDQRAQSQNEESYTHQLLKGPLNRLIQKVGEEAIETVIAATSQNKQEFIDESSDMLYHLLVLLHRNELSLDDLEIKLSKRHKK